jgi:hypothetical protein
VVHSFISEAKQKIVNGKAMSILDSLEIDLEDLGGTPRARDMGQELNSEIFSEF